MNKKQMVRLIGCACIFLLVATSCMEVSTNQGKTFSLPKAELRIASKEKAVEKSGDRFLKKMQYTIDIVPEQEKEKVGSLDLEFDYLYSSELGQTEIKNHSITPVGLKGPWNIKAELFGIAGTGSELSVIEYTIQTSNMKNPDAPYASNTLIIAVDKDGKAEILSRTFIERNTEADKKYSELQKQSGRDNFEKLVRTHDSASIEGSKITYQIEEYQSNPYLIGGVNAAGKVVDDLYAKTARYTIKLQYAGEEIGTEKIVVSFYGYSPSEDYARISASNYQMEGHEKWLIENDPKQKGVGDEIANGTGVSLYTRDWLIKNDDKIIEQLRICIAADAKGNLSINPVRTY